MSKRWDVVNAMILNKEQQLWLVRGQTELWSLPGGKRSEDETLEDAAIRHIREQTSLSTKVAGLLHVDERLYNEDHVTFLPLLRRYMDWGLLSEAVSFFLDKSNVCSVY
ncbi:NUDIX hydrolase [Bacillus fonticola]|uniref:NUDIX hydrolase n=1 Tax=Bacillus fonticola TaxID=2728853 RepID=UPI00147449E1|nr:NUDIX hydrolase [Bacillus fonticola]